MSDIVGIWEWRVWSKGHKRICDSGTAFADSEGQARAIAGMCLGGPHAHEVVEFQLIRVANGTPVKRGL